MTVAELTKRVAALEKAVEELQAKISSDPKHQRHWWRDDAGRFANDPAFDEMMQLVREYRESLHPDHPKNRKKKRKPKSNARA
jgi:hypothetical protein